VFSGDRKVFSVYQLFWWHTNIEKFGKWFPENHFPENKRTIRLSFFFKKSIIPLSVFILPLTDLLTLSNSFFVITCLLNNSSYLGIWVLNSSWMPLAILRLPRPFSSIILLSHNHLSKLLVIYPSLFIRLMIHICSIGMEYLIAYLSCILQWLNDSMVFVKIATERLIRSCSYSMKAFAASKLITPIPNGNITNPNIAKATSLYHSSPNFPSLTFFFIRLWRFSTWILHQLPYIGWFFPSIITWLPLK